LWKKTVGCVSNSRGPEIHLEKGARRGKIVSGSRCGEVRIASVNPIEREGKPLMWPDRKGVVPNNLYQENSQLGAKARPGKKSPLVKNI